MSNDKQSQQIKKRGGKRPGAGRPKGSLNTKSIALKEMILGALNKAGGVDYLAVQAGENPSAFLALVGKVLPMTVQGTGDNGALTIQILKLSDADDSTAE